jgi:putative molybdopterin biosynthesis protein
MPEVLRSHQGSYNALSALYAGRADIATCHLWDEETGEYNLPYIPRLLPGLGRRGGAALRPHRRVLRCKGQSPGSDGLGRPGAARHPAGKPEKGSGIRVLLDGKLRRMGIVPASVEGYGDERPNHAAVAAAVAGGEGDVGVGIESVARQVPDAGFVPLQREWYDMVIPAGREAEPAMRSVTAFALSEAFRKELRRIGLYDFDQSGKIFRV